MQIFSLHVYTANQEVNHLKEASSDFVGFDSLISHKFYNNWTQCN